MKTPFDTIKGRIVDYDEKTHELIIRAPYDDINCLIKREYKNCELRLIDSRPLSDKQRRACYALMHVIADYCGMGLEYAKQMLKLKFLTDNMQEIGDRLFSLSNAPMSLVCAYQRFLVRMILDYDIPCDFHLLDFVDDVGDYLYACIEGKKCCVCGRHADLHHRSGSRVGTGRDRDEINHLGLEVLPLCREHHIEVHTIGEDTFAEKYHIEKGIAVDKTIAKIYSLHIIKASEELAG